MASIEVKSGTTYIKQSMDEDRKIPGGLPDFWNRGAIVNPNKPGLFEI